MQKKRILSLLLAASCYVSLLTGCGGKTGPETNGGDGERCRLHPLLHPV